MLWLLVETSFAVLVNGWSGRRVSVGESKLCHRTTLVFRSSRTRLPESWRLKRAGESELVVVVQTWD